MGDRVVYGGQAVVEGVMMRGARHFAVACRLPDGEIVVKREEVPAIFTRYRWAKWPFLRGSFALFDSLVLGMKALMFSANLAAEHAVGGQPAGNDGAPVEQKKISSIAVAGSAAAGMGLGMVLFLFMPSVLVGWLFALAQWAGMLAEDVKSPLALNLAEGFLRVAMVLGYIALIGRMGEVKRLFQYHGAEHKAINGWENEGAVSEDAATRQSRIHPRCGTNFVLTVLMVKVIVFAFFGWQDAVWMRLLLRLALLPVVAGIAYEVIRLAGTYRKFAPLQWLVMPGLLTQKLTTREPDAEHIEVAVAALKAVHDEPAPVAMATV